MSFREIESSSDLKSTINSPNPTLVHYFEDKTYGPAYQFLARAALHGIDVAFVDFYCVQGDKSNIMLPSTVLYKEGEEVQTAGPYLDEIDSILKAAVTTWSRSNNQLVYWQQSRIQINHVVEMNTC